MIPVDQRKPQSHTNRRENTEVHLLDYLKIIQKRMWICVIVFIAIVAVVVVYTLRTQPLYQTTASIMLEQKEFNVGIQQILSEDKNIYNFYTDQCEIIKSRLIAKKVIDILDLKNHPGFNPYKGIENPALAADNPSDPFTETYLINAFLSGLNVSLMRNSGVVCITYTGDDPYLITTITNAIVKTYIEQDWERRYSVAKEALEWLNKQMENVKDAVEQSELALQKYKKENNIFGIEPVGSGESGRIEDPQHNVVFQKLEEINAAITKAKIERLRLETLYNKLAILKNAQNQAEIIQSIAPVVQNDLIQNLKGESIRIQNEISLYSNRYGPKHPKVVQLNTELHTMRNHIIKEVERLCNHITIEYEIAKSNEATLLSLFEQQKNEVFTQGDRSIQYGVLKREADTNRQMYETLLTRIKETNLAEDFKVSNIRVIDYAEVPLGPYKPNKSINTLVGIITGLACGVGIAFLMEYMDKTIKTQEDVKKYFGTVLLGIVGHIPQKKKDARTMQLITYNLPKYPITESIKRIRTSIMFSHPDNPKKTLLISSAIPSEGKTLLTSNLGVVMAQTGKKVLLVDADLRNPSLHKTFELDESSGLSNSLINPVNLHRVARVTKVPNLYVITSGPPSPNPSELLSSSAMVEFLKVAREEYDWIIIDSPPLLTVTDGSILARMVDGIVFVLRNKKTSIAIAQKGAGCISAVHDKILGVVINDLDFSDEYRYHYYDKKERYYQKA
ncbi:MAG: Tyrosine-protein kinase EpsD [Candidatus Jettenia ecosi]|uniref:Tyrosine-protein kinase EpsD n=1 Tax=Candidatus Jettenia ecosi TaxID=2494326 RepID=A0A533Q6B7_9BACT|nr:MAG: Tyrosine-protein kinase EpsD [Candidatus Jettenia ecosi]